ncbi:polygalacturonase [Curtobacterium flaccumfaciens pv. poinsettiae]|nr:polygalacturonase [Curtobacterium flaccumfaciens pv. poinsettiae]
MSMHDRQANAETESVPPDTHRIQQALDECAKSGGNQVVIQLSPSGESRDFLSGPLQLHAGEILLLAPEVTLFASRNPADFQAPGGVACGTISSKENGCVPFISLANHSGIESTENRNGARGAIDGRGDQEMIGRGLSWWQLAQAAKDRGYQNVPRLLQAQKVNDVTLYSLDLINSPGSHVSFKDGTGFTAWGVHIKTPVTARNTDGIDPAGASDVTVIHSSIMDGDDGIAIKAGSQPSAHITIKDNIVDGSHGISIGSETTAGVSDVLVVDNTINGMDSTGKMGGTAAGIRIKSSAAVGGVVRQITYKNTCVLNTKIPLSFDTHYSSGGGHAIPWYEDIVVDGFQSSSTLRNGYVELNGWDNQHALGVKFSGTAIDTTNLKASNAKIVDAGVRFGGRPLGPLGPTVHISREPARGNVPDCAAG